MSLLPALIGLLVVIGALVYLGITSLEPFLIYRPERARTDPAEAMLAGVEEIELKTPDGNSVLAWWSPPQPGRPTILYFHGNGGSLADRANRIARFQQAGLGVFMMTYRGYGGSTGRPTERDNVADARRAYEHLLEMGLRPREIVLFGESLGTGVAVQLAAAREVAGLILDSPYTSMVDLARLHYPLLPAGLVMKDRYETTRHIGGVSAPLLIIHGAADQIVPVEMARQVFATARAPKEFVEFPGAGHIEHDAVSFDGIMAWIARLRRGDAGLDR